jgi:carbon-monoxide dehydrogenase small subunit
MRIEVTVNGKPYVRDVAENRTLLHFLREELGLTGSKEGCGMGECGACTVFLNGKAVNSCCVLAVEADGAFVDTIEGEAGPDGLSEIQKAFDRNQAVQCGFCTPGMVMSVRELLKANPTPSAQEIKEALEGNFCRCTGYEQIVEAVLDLTGQGEKKGGLGHV